MPQYITGTPKPPAIGTWAEREILRSLESLLARLESLESDVRAIMNHLELGNVSLEDPVVDEALRRAAATPRQT